jgi:N-acetylneuraminic acid mutarotase
MSEKQTQPFDFSIDPSLSVDLRGSRATTNVRLVLAVAALFGSLLIAGCGGGGTQGGNTPPVTYTVGGTVSGLAGSGLVLQNNGGNNLAVSANGTFTFTAALASGTAYKVTVLSQPTNPNQTCTVSGGTGTLTSNVTNVSVTCTIDTYTIGGSVINLVGTGGGLKLQDNGGDTLLVNGNGGFTFPTALLSGSTYSVTVFVQPSNPAQTCGVTNGSGTATGNVTDVVVDCGHNEWTWIGGSNIVAQKGTYGTLGAPSAANIPGARYVAINWTDASGDFWLFGGNGYDSTGFESPLNDLWKYSAGEWIWMSGSSLAGQKGVYGTLGLPAASNIPGSRLADVSWTDASGDFWLFGGDGYDSAGTNGSLNDLWKYSSGQWTWIGGSNLAGQKGSYGTLGVSSATNIPGARSQAVSWADRSGNFWLFGGYGYDSAGTHGYLNDLWEYSSGQWTWMGGSNLVNQKGIYGTQGTSAPGNVPGARAFPVTWTDANGNLWLFGGGGYDSAGTQADLNDLWEYSAGQWIWRGGSNIGNQKGIYGTQGTAGPGNVPGARAGSVTWTDASGNFWLFGGGGYDSVGTQGLLNDLWKYSAGQWTWIGGSNLIPSCTMGTCGQKGTYGTQGLAALGNMPGARADAVIWTDASGNLWLFGGAGNDSAGTSGPLNDLWKYRP